LRTPIYIHQFDENTFQYPCSVWPRLARPGRKCTTQPRVVRFPVNVITPKPLLSPIITQQVEQRRPRLSSWLSYDGHGQVNSLPYTWNGPLYPSIHPHMNNPTTASAKPSCDYNPVSTQNKLPTHYKFLSYSLPKSTTTAAQHSHTQLD
jgi:hypothetical protein